MCPALFEYAHHIGAQPASGEGFPFITGDGQIARVLPAVSPRRTRNSGGIPLRPYFVAPIAAATASGRIRPVDMIGVDMIRNPTGISGRNLLCPFVSTEVANAPWVNNDRWSPISQSCVDVEVLFAGEQCWRSTTDHRERIGVDLLVSFTPWTS